MINAFSAVAPLFIILILGFTAGFSSRFTGASSYLSSFVLYFGLPAFIYSSVTAAPLTAGIPVGGVIIAVGVSLSLFFLVFWLTRWKKQSDQNDIPPTALAATFANLGFLGLPLAVAFIGPEAALPAAILHLINNVLFMSGYPILNSYLRRSSTRPDSNIKIGALLVRSLVVNPTAVAVLAALTVSLTPVSIPEVLDETATRLGDAAVPVALFSVGLTMHPAFRGIRQKNISLYPIVLGFSSKLLLAPAFTYLLTLPIQEHLGTTWTLTLVLLAAMPSSTMVYILSDQYNQRGPLGAAILVTCTVVSLGTLPLVAMLII